MSEIVTIHEFDKRLSSVELECAFFNDKLNNFSSRFDKIDDGLSDVNKKLDHNISEVKTQLTGIQVSMSKNEGNKEGSMKIFNKFWIVAYSIAMLLAGSGIDKFFLK